MINEHDYLAEKCYSRNGQLNITFENAQRMAKIARIRGKMKAYSDCGCAGSYDQEKARLKSLLNGKNYRFENATPLTHYVK